MAVGAELDPIDLVVGVDQQGLERAFGVMPEARRAFVQRAADFHLEHLGADVLECVAFRFEAWNLSANRLSP